MKATKPRLAAGLFRFEAGRDCPPLRRPRPHGRTLPRRDRSRGAARAQTDRILPLENGGADQTAVLALFDAEPEPTRPTPERAASTSHRVTLTVYSDGQEAANRWFAASGIGARIEDFPWIGRRGLFITDPEGNPVQPAAALNPAKEAG